MNIIALDIGTTGVRALIINQNLQILKQSYQPLAQHYPQSGWVEQDALEIWESTAHVLRAVLASGHAVSAIGLTNQRETTIVWDKKTGTPIHGAISWQCRRTAERCSAIGSNQQRLFWQKTGLRTDAYFSASKLEWLFKTYPDALKKAQSGDLLFGTVDSWILWHLTEGAVHATDVSNASRTLLFNLETMQFDKDLCDFWGVPMACLPEVKASDAHFGDLSERLFGRKIPIRAILGDQQASLFSQCGDDQTQVKNTYGTGLFVMASTGEKPVHSQALITTVAWQRDGKVSYALEGSIFTGGSLIQWLRDELGLIHSSSETEALALQAGPLEHLFLVPALNGLGAPYWDSSARGLLIGLHRGSTKAQIVRAALESLAYQTAEVISEMGASFKTLKVDGGASQNGFLMQFQSDVLGMAVEKPALTELTAIGAAGLAGIASGVWQEQEFRAAIVREKQYLPSQDPTFNTAKWKEAVARSREWMQ